MPKEGSQFICLSVILIVSVFRTGKNYYSQVFLEECNFIAKEKDCRIFLDCRIVEYSSDFKQFTTITYMTDTIKLIFKQIKKSNK